MNDLRFSLTERIKSFKHAINGLKILIYEEYNAQIHVVVTLLVTAISFVLRINKTEWLAIILCIGLMFATEIINSAIENICDFISPEKHKKIKRIKDLSAAAVLVAAIISAIVGSFVFIPKFLNI